VVSSEEALGTLRAHNVAAEIVHPDRATEDVFASVDGNLLDPSIRAAAAHAGRDQGRRIARMPFSRRARPPGG
jgi:hypothetical protein